MQNLWILIVFLLLGLFSESKAQTSYEDKMKIALTEFHKAKTEKELEKSALRFEEISKSEPKNWIPKYYYMLSKTFSAFAMDTKKALKTSDQLDDEFESLEALNPNPAEALILRALYRTVKVAKEPMTYGMTLPSAIIRDYNEALVLDPENPRANYLLAQFNMKSAPFWGKDPLMYCPEIKKAKLLFQKQKTEGFNPNWGEDEVDEILTEDCKK